MATVTFLGGLQAKASQNLVYTVTSTIPVGDSIVIVGVTDNNLSATNVQNNSFANTFDSKSNQWENYYYSVAAHNAGANTGTHVVGRMDVSWLSTALVSGDTITIQASTTNTAPARAVLIYRVSGLIKKTSPSAPIVLSTDNKADAGQSFIPKATGSLLLSVSLLESTASGFTQDSSWNIAPASIGTSGGGAASNVAIYAAWRESPGTSNAIGHYPTTPGVDDAYAYYEFQTAVSPDNVTDLQATNGSNVSLSWTAPAGGAQSYSIYRQRTSQFEQLLASNVVGTTYSDTSATPNPTGYTYTYRVVSRNDGAPQSSGVTTSVFRQIFPPSNVTVSGTGSSAVVSWTPPTQGVPPASYTVYRSNGNVLTGDASTFTNSIGGWTSLAAAPVTLTVENGALRATMATDGGGTAYSPPIACAAGAVLEVSGKIRQPVATGSAAVLGIATLYGDPPNSAARAGSAGTNSTEFQSRTYTETVGTAGNYAAAVYADGSVAIGWAAEIDDVSFVVNFPFTTTNTSFADTTSTGPATYYLTSSASGGVSDKSEVVSSGAPGGVEAGATFAAFGIPL